MKSEGSPACLFLFFFFFSYFWQSKRVFQCAFIVGLWAMCCKISISQEWAQNLFQTMPFSIQTYHSIPNLGVHQHCQICHPPLPCSPFWAWNFSKYYTAFCKIFSVWLSFDNVRGSSALSIQPQEEGKALPGRLGTPVRNCGDAVQVKSCFHLSLLYICFSWKIFNTKAIICSLFYYPWLFSVI